MERGLTSRTPTLPERVDATRRPRRRAIGGQQWRSLLFLHWPVPPDTIARLLPAGLTLDLYDGSAYVGLVPFLMKGVRWLGTPARFGFCFLETNVRTYVHVEGRAPGVYFFSLDAASLPAVLGARAGWGLPYFFARMSLFRASPLIRYRVRRLSGTCPRLAVEYRVGEPLGHAQPGTLDHFLIERYLLLVERRGRLVAGRVHHPPYPLHRTTVTALRDELVAAAGLPAPPGPPPIVHYSPGIDVEVFAPRRIVL